MDSIELQKKLTQANHSLLDQLNHANTAKTVSAAFRALEASQYETQGVILMSQALLLITLCKKQRMSPTDVLNKASRVLQNASASGDQHLAALEHFLKVHLVDSV